MGRSLILYIFICLIPIGFIIDPSLLTYVLSDVVQSISVYGGTDSILDSTGIDATTMTFNNLALLIGTIISIISILMRPSRFYSIYSIFFLIYGISMLSLLSMPWYGLVAYRFQVNNFGLMFIFIPLLFSSRFCLIPFQRYAQPMFLFSVLIGFRFFYTLSRSAFDFAGSFWLLANPLVLLIQS